MISISVPFIFDHRQLPNEFMGLILRTDIYDLPMEFQNIDTENKYIWAYQRFEIFVDKHVDLIKQKLDNLNITRQEILDALCFGDYNKHKENCKKWESEGKIPSWI
ncbi:MAG: hypothetical protein HC905_20655 [Bacteroidales bacterium]|nr:hypothetical protein [Bacteroidales bacterium]